MGKTTEQKQYEITAAEVGNAWNKLVGRYDLIESLMILINYLKDEDLRKEVKRIIKRLNQQVRDLENIMTEHTVALPPKPAAKYAIKEPMAPLTDRYIYLRIFYSLKRFLPVHMVAYQQSTYPRLREMFKSILLEEMVLFAKIQNLGLKKNWLEPQEEYTSETTAGRETPTIMEVAQAWNKLYSRYDVLEFTNYMANLARNVDLKTAIALGQETLRRQIVELEKMLQKYKTSLPVKPPETETTARPVDAISDRYIYRQMLKGIQSFLPVHMVAFQESTTPTVQKKFKKLLVEEIEIYDYFLAFGQLKGWVYNPPSFKG